SLQRFFAKYPDRSFDCGITEEHAMTFAAGLAISGKRPYIPVYSSFLQRAYDQINHDICRMDLPVVIGIDHAGL
ncbi:1-deoxy-D-xylulose-5-phosphate synthase, partial [Acinetobacter soli]|nr:1-deoxy-D-xylulose-5-phosphate synthase [Acinetobacter soli]